jgi:class 3 adenylate cyclase/tetratricopeptide (TPR) repeat protein
MSSCSSCGEQNPERARFCWSCGAALSGQAAAKPEVRKTVTVLFCDVTGSTALGDRLDPESLRAVMARYYERMRQVVERHGGTVAKFIGDAVVAVFGVPTLHEDDPVRALRAAVEMTEAVQALNVELERSWGVVIQVRTGVNTGDVVAGDPTISDALVLGDAVNVAARLEQAAEPWDILIGSATYRLVHDAVRVEPVTPLMLKGKELPVSAWRVVRVTAGGLGHSRRTDSPLVGREEELALLGQAFRRAVRERRCVLFTLLGEAGVGKSRLVAEFLARTGQDATALSGRCLSYGEGITFWPVAEVVRQACGLLNEDTPETARQRLDALLEGTEGGALVVEALAGVLGLSTAPTAVEDVSSAMRKLFEALARRRPLIVSFDDLHWAEPTFLDLVEHIGDWSRDAPILLACVARPEFLDARPQWAGGKLNAASVLLEPLGTEESGQLVTNLLSADLAEQAQTRITEAAEGNPLFLEEFLRMLIDDDLLTRSGDHWTPTTDLATISVPATIQALLAARLDQLDSEDRAVLQRASVIGKVFDAAAVAELSPKAAQPSIRERLMALLRKELIRPSQEHLADGEAFRFRHDLIRDAAYASLPKQHRAELHERFAGWLERRVGDRLAEYEEIVGHHFERAYRLRSELGPIDEAARALAQAAAARLGVAGRRAFDRLDVPAACNLLRRAAALLTPDDPALPGLKVALGMAFLEAGMVEEADAVLAEAAATASDEGLARLAAVERTSMQMELHPDRIVVDQVTAEAEASIAVFTRLSDDRGLARSWRLLAEVHWLRCHFADMAMASERALEHARRTKDGWEEGWALALLSTALDCGPTPAGEAIERCQVLLAEAGKRRWETGMLGPLAHLEAMRGQFPVARELIERGRAIAEEFRLTYPLPWLAWWSGKIEMLAGDLVAAERELRLSYAMYQQMSEKATLSTVAADVAGVLAWKGRISESLRLTEESRVLAAREDVWSHTLWRSVQATVLAQQGQTAEAERLARAAGELAAQTDFLDLHAGVLRTLAEVLRSAGNAPPVRALLEDAALLYRQKGNLVSLARVETLLNH